MNLDLQILICTLMQCASPLHTQGTHGQVSPSHWWMGMTKKKWTWVDLECSWTSGLSLISAHLFSGVLWARRDSEILEGWQSHMGGSGDSHPELHNGPGVQLGQWCQDVTNNAAALLKGYTHLTMNTQRAWREKLAWLYAVRKLHGHYNLGINSLTGTAVPRDSSIFFFLVAELRS